MASRDSVSHRYHGIPWASAGVRDVEADIECAVRSDLNVLITGERGVGKCYVAYHIHRESGRAAAPLASARGPDVLDWSASLDAAFNQARPRGTVLLRHAERMSAVVQAHLQRRIEEVTARPRDAGTSPHRPVRVLTTASHELADLVVRGRFAERLFYHLNTIHVRVSPLREHPEDIPVLLRHFLRLYGQVPVPRISLATEQRLARHTWPGNLWELRAVAWRLARHVSRPCLQPEDLPPGTGL